MRGDDNRTGKLFSYVDLEARVDDPLRAIRRIMNGALLGVKREFVWLNCWSMPDNNSQPFNLSSVLIAVHRSGPAADWTLVWTLQATSILQFTQA